MPGIGVPVAAPLEVPGLPAPELSGVLPGVPDAPEPALPEPLLPPEPSGALLELEPLPLPDEPDPLPLLPDDGMLLPDDPDMPLLP